MEYESLHAMCKSDEVKELVVKAPKDGKVTILTIDGLVEANIDNLLSQPIEGLLYDLNRDELSLLAIRDNPRWINDYAMMQILKYVTQKIQPCTKDN